ncbi:ABC transporter substrate-binding protein [uncultured Roseibium sp.]|uniref:heme/hemin ABC transporter substrate-binding protein n=1 Tax=uncultured Roseibium sp. TaxID=1936171 RepID=UPI003217B39A
MTASRSLPRAARWLATGLSFAMGFMAAGPVYSSDRLPESADRIVAIGGALTEIIYALGEQDRLVARDSTASFPAEVLSLPDVGYMRALSPEGVLSVKPDGILAIEGSGPPEAVSVLASAGVPFVTVPEGFSGEAIQQKIRAVGTALGVDGKAEALSSQVAADLAEAVSEAHKLNRTTRVLFVLSYTGGRVLASGTGTAADAIIRMAGAKNAIEGVPGYKQLNEEAITAAHPDVILMMERHGDEKAASEILANAAIAQTPAGQNKRLIRMNGLYLLGFGPRTASAVRELSDDLADFGL